MCLVDKIALQMQVLMKQFPVHEVPVLLELIFTSDCSLLDSSTGHQH